MAKDKLKLGEPRDNNQKTRPRSQKCKNKGSEEKISPCGRRKSLSLSFYNQQTLQGSKKIMLDLLPIEGVQTQYTSSRNHRIQLQKFAQLQTKSTIERNKKLKPEKKQFNQSSGNSKSREKRKNSLHVLPSQRKALFNEPRTGGSNQKSKPGPIKSENTRNPSRREAYLQKYLNGYLKKAKLCK